MACKYCGKTVVLNPSAKVRAMRYGKTPAYYTNLFKDHSQCILDNRKKELTELLIHVK